MDLPVAPTWAEFLKGVQNERQSQELAGSEFGPSSGLPGVLIQKDSEGRVMSAAAWLYDRAVHAWREEDMCALQHIAVEGLCGTERMVEAVCVWIARLDWSAVAASVCSATMLSLSVKRGTSGMVHVATETQ